MPVLKKEHFFHPTDLFEADWNLAEQGLKWGVLHTRPRAEKAVARWLVNDGTPFFLPLFERRYRRQRRLIRSFLPLFPGYVFLLEREDELSPVLKTNHVVSRLHVPDQQRLHSDLYRVFQLIESEARIAPEDRLEPGMPAEIISGPMKGYRGTVLRRGAGLRFVVAVDFLQRGASVEVESTDIRPL